MHLFYTSTQTLGILGLEYYARSQDFAHISNLTPNRLDALLTLVINNIIPGTFNTDIVKPDNGLKQCLVCC